MAEHLKKHENGRILKSTATLVLALALAACNSTTPGQSVQDTADSLQNQPQTDLAAAPPSNQGFIDQEFCPRLNLRSGTENYRKYSGKEEVVDNVQYQATILKIARECNYNGNVLNMKIGASGRVIAGPKGGSGRVVMPIRVAVQDLSGPEPCSRYFTLHQHAATIPQGTNGSQFQFIDGNLSMPAGLARKYRVYVGFDEGPYNEGSAKKCTG